MSNPFGPPWDRIPGDGASAPVGMPSPFDDAPSDDLLEAWCQERHQSIELGLYLQQSLQLIRRILADGEVTPESRRRAKTLLRAIREAKRDDLADFA